MIKTLFKLHDNQTDIKTEIIAGMTTFMTMSYIIFVQPAVLSMAGMDFGSVMVATCIASAVATFLMGVLANYPIALAPAMGHNFFFTFTVCLGMKVAWQTALGAVWISGCLFVLLSFFGVREKIINAIPSSLKHAIAVGIGLFIALIGFQWAGIVVAKPGVMIGLGNLSSKPVLLSFFGVFLISTLLAFEVKGAVLIGIIVCALCGIPLGVVKFSGVVASPPSLSATFLKLDIIGAFKMGIIPIIFVFFFLDLFDTIGTLIGVSEQAGFIKDGRLPRAQKALLADAVGTVSGAMLGTSTVTSYIESSTGVAAGARTGLSNMVTAGLFLLSIFFYPLAQMVGGGFEIDAQTKLYPVIAPSLIVVGSLMMKNITKINWDKVCDAMPAFLTITLIPFSYSITEGISAGFVSYSLIKTLRLRFKEVHPLVYIVSILFIIRYFFLKIG